MSTPRTGMTELKPGDRVWFDGYGVGVVQSINALWLWITWERTGLMNHDPSFGQRLKRM